VLLYYSPFSAMEINSVKHDWVERVGAECANADIPFFLEIVNYHDEMDEKGAEFARIKPQSVTCAIETVLQAALQVDVGEGRSSGEFDVVEGQNQSGTDAIYTRQEAIGHFLQASQVATCRSSIFQKASATKHFDLRWNGQRKQVRNSLECCADARTGRTECQFL